LPFTSYGYQSLNEYLKKKLECQTLPSDIKFQFSLIFFKFLQFYMYCELPCISETDIECMDKLEQVNLH